jgi:hypothetical protein
LLFKKLYTNSKPRYRCAARGDQPHTVRPKLSREHMFNQGLPIVVSKNFITESPIISNKCIWIAACLVRELQVLCPACFYRVHFSFVRLSLPARKGGWEDIIEARGFYCDCTDAKEIPQRNTWSCIHCHSTRYDRV